VKILLAPIPSIMSLVPEVEEPDTWRLLCALAGLETFIRAFKNAVDLFDFLFFKFSRCAIIGRRQIPAQMTIGLVRRSVGLGDGDI
jgi:hypothetical protein